ncbi:MAG: hypothetical protein ACLTR6_11400 [Clostridium fessum]
MKRAERTARRATRKSSNYMGADVTVYQSIPMQPLPREFVGYDRLTA